MTRLHDLPLGELQFYATAPYPCSYLPGREARSQVVTPGCLITTALYGTLIDAGFRRSGVFTYRPHCDRCRACIPVRIPVDQFKPSRTQRRAQHHHQQLTTHFLPLQFVAEHYELYCRYQLSRHSETDLEENSLEQYHHFLLQSPVKTHLVEFRENGVLRMVSIIDVLKEGLSSVYTFFEPGLPGTSYGIYNILWQIEHCKERGLPWLYLGYWIKNSQKMNYKIEFQPMHGFIDHQGCVLPKPQPEQTS